MSPSMWVPAADAQRQDAAVSWTPSKGRPVRAVNAVKVAARRKARDEGRAGGGAGDFLRCRSACLSFSHTHN
eukprot:scaffold109035_cov51-Phaeocystis_antarctica.AAC.2